MSRLATGVVVAAIAVAACGGGDGMSTAQPPPPTSSYDLHAAMAAFETREASTSVNLSGTVIGGGSSQLFTGSGTLSQSSGANGMFNGSPALLQTTTIAGTVTTGGTSTAYSSGAVTAYDSATAAIVGESQSTEFDVASAPIMIPTSIGTMPMVLGTLSRYADSTLSVALGTTQISVEVEFIPVDPGSEEVVQFTFQSYNMSGALVETDTQSFYLSKDSMLSFYGATANDASGSLSVTLQ